MPRTLNPFLSENTAVPAARLPESVIRPEISTAFKTIVDAMNRRPMNPEEVAKRDVDYRARVKITLESWIKSIRSDIETFSKEKETALSEFDQLAERLRAGDMGDGHVKVGQMALPQVVGQIRLLVRDKNKSGSMDIPNNWKGLASAASSVRYMLSKRDATVAHVPQETTSTTYQIGRASCRERV